MHGDTKIGVKLVCVVFDKKILTNFRALSKGGAAAPLTHKARASAQRYVR